MASGLGLTYTATATWQNAGANAAACAVSWNITLPVAPSGASGYVVVMVTSGGTAAAGVTYSPTGVLSGITTTTVSIGGCQPGTSGLVYGIVGYSMIG